MRATEIMTRSVITIQPHASIADAIRLMLGQRISGLPVVGTSGSLVGILTEGDLLRRAETGTERRRPRLLDFLRGAASQAQDYVRTHGRKVQDIMTRDVVSAAEDAQLDEIVELMESKRIRRVPIVTNHRLVGVVSRADLLRVLAKVLGQIPPAAPGDPKLREQIVAEMQRQAWSGRSHVTVVVTDGVVDLEGIIYNISERDALRVAAENVPGVKEVRDHLDYLDPNVGLIYPM